MHPFNFQIEFLMAQLIIAIKSSAALYSLKEKNTKFKVALKELVVHTINLSERVQVCNGFLPTRNLSAAHSPRAP